MDLGIAGRTALVVGASRGVGAATARVLAAEGAHVVMVARRGDVLEGQADALRAQGHTAIALAGDASDATFLDDVIERASIAVGPPLLVVHCVAALYTPTRFAHVSDDDITRLLDTDLASAARLARRVLPAMMEARFGRIVLVGSMAAQHGVSGAALYAAAKAGLEGLARGIALDHGRHGVTANAVRLGPVDSERFRERTAHDPAQRARVVAETATHTLPTPDDVARVIAFLCSTSAGCITGTALEVTAGAHLNTAW